MTKYSNVSSAGHSNLRQASTVTAASKQRTMQKSIVKDGSMQAAQTIAFSELCNQPLFQGIFDATCPENLKQEIAALGFGNSAQLVTYQSQQLRSQQSSSEPKKEIPYDLLDHAKRQAQKTFRLMQRTLAIKDPMNQALRHTNSQLSTALETAYQASGIDAYAKPSSLQSNQSSAAYLRHLYRIATGTDSELGIVEPEESALRLSSRRPDLASLVLSDANLKQEIPTIKIINEVLDAGLGDIEIDRTFYPIALPFNAAEAKTRAALKHVNNTTINDILIKTLGDDFPLQPNFTLVADPAGLLGLNSACNNTSDNGDVCHLLTQSNDNDDTHNVISTLELFGTSDINGVSPFDYLQKSLDLDTDALIQLLGLYPVYQERGETVQQQEYATAFLQNQNALGLIKQGSEVIVQYNGSLLDAPLLRSLHYLARLHHGSGIGFHHLNLLLSIAGASEVVNTSDTNSNARTRITQTGIRVLASYKAYDEIFGISVEAYVGLFNQVCPFWRADSILELDESEEPTVVGLEQTETSFMHSLFGNDSAWLHATITKASTPLSDDKLAAIVRKGLGVTNLELEALTSVLNENFGLSTGLDSRGLGALYRLTTLFNLLDWPVITGIELVKLVDQQINNNRSLWASLISKNVQETETAALLTALDTLVNLAQWMQEIELSAPLLLRLLNPTNDQTLPSTDEDINWFNSLALAVKAMLVNDQSYREFEYWNLPDGKKVTITGEQWHRHFIQSQNLYHACGVFFSGLTLTSIEAVCSDFLASVYPQINLDDDTNHAQLKQLVLKLDRAAQAQVNITHRQIASLNSNLTITGVAPLISWMQTDTLSVLQTLLPGADDCLAVNLLAQLHRYAKASEVLGLGDIDLWVVGYRSHWLDGSSNEPLSLNLQQLYYLHRFTSLQTGVASDAAWRGYLDLSNELDLVMEDTQTNPEVNRTACLQALAILLGCHIDDLIAYSTALFSASSLVNTVKGIDTIARHVHLAQQLNVGAVELLALTGISQAKPTNAWLSAQSAAEACLLSFDSGAQYEQFENVFAEQQRDALVAAFMQTNIAKNQHLAERVINRETLYTHLLLDINVSSQVPTSRVVEAISTLQLYISRALNGLELGVTFSNRVALEQQWQIDKNYRQWEANKKLELYPQNYIEPELRYITSPEFDQFLQATSAGDLNETSAEAAVNNYMSGLANACSLSICSLYVERLAGATEPVNANYHFLASSDWEPGRFFYRKLEADFQAIERLENPADYVKALDWTYWQEVNISSTFELFTDVSVCVFQNRYFFFWLELEERKIQETDGQKTVWRLHPRYMRCDANALTGTTFTPGLFIEGLNDNNSQFLSLDGAFEWSNTKPSITGIYQPVVGVGALVYGQSQDNDTSETDNVLLVKYGIEQIINHSEKSIVQQSALLCRLTDDWADAILVMDDAVDTHLQDAAPREYNCIHSSAFASTVDSLHLRLKLESLDYYYLHTDPMHPQIHIRDRLCSDTTSASFTTEFKASPFGNPRTGTIETRLSLIPSYNIDFHYEPSQNDPNGRFNYIKAITPSIMKIQTELSFKVGDKSETHKGHWYESPMQPVTLNKEGIAFIDDDPIFALGYTEQHKSMINIPLNWSVELGETKEIEVYVNIERTPAEYEVSYQAFTMDLVFSPILEPAQSYKTERLYLGAFIMKDTEVKQNIAWAHADTHGSRNFAHIMNHYDTPVDQTMLLSNSSSALAGLAKSMPRPGDYRDLFSIENQKITEDVEPFKNDFAETLKKVYTQDTSALNPVLTPAIFFDFNAAYGGYGWETFYHMPITLATNYAANGKFDESLSWFKKVFDPQSESPWKLLPMINAQAPDNGFAFDTGDTIIDPDRIATDYPVYYQQATIRQYLETLLAAGDAAYQMQTQESLQQAKATYVSAKQLFNENVLDTLSAMTNHAWSNPRLSEAAVDSYGGFLPPLNKELEDLYDLFEERISNIRQWLDIEGNPLNVALLSAPIAPRELQLTAKSALRLDSGDVQKEEQDEPLLDFITVARAVRHYLANLKTTSARLQAALEKNDGASLNKTSRLNNKNKIKRSLELQELTIDAAEKTVDIKQANLAGANSAVASYVAGVLTTKMIRSATDTAQSALYSILRLKIKAVSISNRISGGIQARIPTIYGFSNGGQHLALPSLIREVGNVVNTLDAIYRVDHAKGTTSSIVKHAEMAFKVTELGTKLATSSLELQHANTLLEKERKQRSNLSAEFSSAERLVEQGNNLVTNGDFYQSMIDEINQLFTEEWATTLELCHLLIKLYGYETNRNDGANFLSNTSPGTGVEKLNAPYRLALDIARLEKAYISTVIDQQSQVSHVTVKLNEISAINGQGSALQALLDNGEVYFDLTQEMIETLYPGQYDRRIQSIVVRFPGLESAQLSPHARLTQISNTRYISRERSAERGANVRKNQHALQSIMLSEAVVDTDLFDYPDGLLKRFQNTGVESQWHLTLPSMCELKSGKSKQARPKDWHKSVTKHVDALTPHLDDVELTVRFTGRW